MIVREMPYSNLHDLNIDWILKIVKDFQEKYQNFDETYQQMLAHLNETANAAIEAITTDKNNAIDAMRAFYADCIALINNKTNNSVEYIQDATNNQLTAINAAGSNQRDLIDAEGTRQVNMINSMILTLPATYEDAINQLQIINSVLNQTYNYPSLVQGHYADSQESDSKTLVADNYRVASLLSTGCASRKLRTQITNVNGIIRGLIYWTGWGSEAVSHYVAVSTDAQNERTLFTYTFPADATYFSYEFAYDYGMTQQLLVANLEVSFQWIFDSLESVQLNEHGFDSSNTGALEFVIPGNDNLTIETGTEIDEIDVAGGSKSVATSHKLKDTTARGSISNLENALPHYLALTYDKATMIPDNTNYDSLTTDGTYKCTTAAHAGTMTNAPASNAHTLYVINSAVSGWVVQIAFINSVANFLVKARIKNSDNTWYPSNSGTNKWITLQTDVSVSAQITALIDATLSISGKAADAKETGDAITALTTAAFQNRGKIADLGYTTIAQCNKMGFYEFTSNDISTENPNRITDLPIGWSTGGYVVTLKKASGAVQYVFAGGKRYVRDGFTGTWYPDATVDTTLTQARFAADAKAVGDRLAALEVTPKKCHAIYNTASYQKSDARLRIYLPQPIGYLMIDMRHYNYNLSSGVANCWGIDNAYSLAENRTTQRFIITQDGEWEMAVRMKDGKDFSGGGTHGDEKNAVTRLFVDGVEKAFSALTTDTEFEELKIIQTSEVYSPTEGFVGDPEGSPTPSYKIADHGTEWIYNKNGITINQYLKWAGAFNIANSFLAMFPVRKYTPIDASTKLPVEGSFHVVDTMYTDTNYSLYDLDANGDGTSVQYPSAAVADIYSEVSGLRCRINAMEYPRTLTGGNKISETDNRSIGSSETNYYKLYWPVTSSNAYTVTAYTTTENEIWKSKVQFDLIIGPGTHFS